MRFFRAGLLILVVCLLREQTRWMSAQRDPRVTLPQAKIFFPEATHLGPRDTERGVRLVFDKNGETLGCVLMTSPETDKVIGYAGPNNTLVALGRDGAIAGVKLLWSEDTEEHVKLVQKEGKFFDSFKGWNSRHEEPLHVAGVSGATLTSYAIAEGVQQRLAGASPSMRFPQAVTIEETQGLFTNVARLELAGPRLKVLDAAGVLLGYVIRTSPQADNVSGYRGPTEALVGLATDEQTVVGVRLRATYDTDSYVDQVRKSPRFLDTFKQRNFDELATLDTRKERIEGVSGATLTGFAVAEGIKRRVAAMQKQEGKVVPWKIHGRDWAMAGVVLGGMAMAFTSLRGNRWVRVVWQLFLVGYVGLIGNDMLSLVVLGGWAAHGTAWKGAPGLLLLAVAAFLVPWTTRRQLYCHQICPHGAAQQLLGGLFRRHALRLPQAKWRWLEGLPVALLGLALVALLSGWPLNLANLEPFDAWVWRAAGGITLAIAIVGLVASIFIPQAYCRFGCPTGALLNFARAAGSGDRWGRRDWGALGLLLAGLVTTGVSRLGSAGASEEETMAFEGRTMGTTWTVKVRDEVQNPAALDKALVKEFEWAEKMTSHWRTNTDLTLFNRSSSTNPIPVPWPVTKLARISQEISRRTDGAFDITVGPLVRLWGFGPGPRRTEPPTREEIERLKPSLGWQRLEILDGQLRKQEAGLEIDLSAIAPGWAVDQVAAMLEGQNYKEFLVESGGELRALGRWKIAIEHPTRSCVLTNESIGTSGSYRQKWAAGGREYSHLLDPRTGQPIAHRTISVSVRHAHCAEADAWAAALNVLGMEQGMPLAESLNLAAQFVVERPNGTLEVRESKAWGR